MINRKRKKKKEICATRAAFFKLSLNFCLCLLVLLDIFTSLDANKYNMSLRLNSTKHGDMLQIFLICFTLVLLLCAQAHLFFSHMQSSLVSQVKCN